MAHTMLRTLRDLFESVLPPPGAPEPDEAHAVQLAAAVLLVEVMRADTEMSTPEREAVVRALRGKFALADHELARLVELAEQTARSAHDFQSFTARLNDHFTPEQKIRMVEAMWEVAYADGHLAAHENHTLRRIADLLYVPHGAYVHAKMRARARSQSAGSGT